MVLRTFNFWGFCGPYRESPYYCWEIQFGSSKKQMLTEYMGFYRSFLGTQKEPQKLENPS